MDIHELDIRKKEDVIQQIKKLAEIYTPEWKCNLENPDAGTALALVFADMFEGTIRRYNRIMEKHQLEFFNILGTVIRPSVPASGYVTFGLSSDEFGGASLPKGTIITAPGSGKDNEGVNYETEESLYVTPSKLSAIFFTDGKEDFIEKKSLSEAFTPFEPEGKNLQEHILYLCQNEILSFKSPGEIRLELIPYCYGKANGKGFMGMKESQFSISYGTEVGFEDFKDVVFDGNAMILKWHGKQPLPIRKSLFGIEGYWIACRLKTAWRKEAFLVEDVKLTSWGKAIPPDVVMSGMGEQENIHIYPFGESPSPFSEIYIASEEVLGKTGAKVVVSFQLDYEAIPLDYDFGSSGEKEWKPIMKRSALKPDPEYDITIERVVWEYYNGSGWSRLLPGEENSSIFCGRENRAGGMVNVEFICPKDAGLLTWQSAPSRYLRIRVMKMNNLYKQKGTYITPVISCIRFDFSYEGSVKRPDYMTACNNLEQTVFPVCELSRGNVCWEIFYGMQEKKRTLYLGFDQPFGKGPIRLFESMECIIDRELPRLIFEYSGKSGFVPLSVIDETEQMKKSGCVSFMGRADAAVHIVHGMRAYWLKITDQEDAYRDYASLLQIPKIERIYLNAARVLAIRQRHPELFEIEPKEEHKVCNLLHANIHTLDVWVNEKDHLSAAEIEQFKKNDKLKEAYDSEGNYTGIWVKWEETEDFCLSDAKDRHYLLERESGKVRFSDGIHGAIPPAGDQPTICIHYSTGGGEEGNQPPDSLNQLTGNYGFVNQVSNPGYICGGHPQETVREALQRREQFLRHRGRAVTAADYESLAMEASRSIWKVKCYPNCNGRGIYEPGRVTLVLLQKEYQAGSMYFPQIREEVQEYISCRMGGNLSALNSLYVVEPQFLEIDTYTEAVAADFDLVFEVQKELHARLNEFIDPITGNYHKKGWEIGSVPDDTQIINALKGIPGIRYIKNLHTRTYCNTKHGRQEVTLSGLKPLKSSQSDILISPRFAIAKSGRSRIIVTAE